MRSIFQMIPELPGTFDLVEGELVQDPTTLCVRIHVPGARGEDPTAPGVYSIPVRRWADLEGRLFHVAWWDMPGWPRVVAWAR